MAHEVIRNSVGYKSANLTAGVHLLVTTPVGRLVGLLALAEKR